MRRVALVLSETILRPGQVPVEVVLEFLRGLAALGGLEMRTTADPGEVQAFFNDTARR